MSESLSQKYNRILSMCEVGKSHGAFTQIQCPCTENHTHGDKEKSASLGLHSNGISFKCFAGCQTDDFLQTLNLTYKDLFPDNELVPTNIYTYHNEDGSYHHDKVKYRNEQGKKTFKQRTIDEQGNISYTASVGVPFQYPQLKQAINQDKIVLYCEGEKDAVTAKILGYEATTMGGASDWKEEYKQFFKEAKLVLIPDKDDAGLKLTGKMVDSLKTTVKSLRTLILPQGKDLTEWVEAGNCDLKPLIESSVELIATKGVLQPIIKSVVGGYELYWLGIDLKVVVDHIENGDTVEIAVYEKEKPIYISGYKLLSVGHKEALARALKKVNEKLKWDVIVNQITVECLERIRNGEQVITLDQNIGKTPPEYLVYPLFVENVVNIIYADRSSAKSIFMILIDLLLHFNYTASNYGLGIRKEHRVLFLDWENDANLTGWQKECLARGMGLDWSEIAYLHCTLPLVKSLPKIQQKINEVKADVVIIDSLGLATGGNLNDSEPALNFYSALRQLPVTPLIIAHTAKDKDNKHKTVYGNAFYENLARSIWEVSKSQIMGEPELTLSLYQRKSPPFASYQNPLGYRFQFDGDKTLVACCEPLPDERNAK